MRPSERITQIYESKRGRDILTPSSNRTLELKLQSIVVFLDELSEKFPKALTVVLLLICTPAFAKEPMLVKKNGQIEISYTTSVRYQLEGNCYKNATLQETETGWNLDAELDLDACTEVPK